MSSKPGEGRGAEPPFRISSTNQKSAISGDWEKGASSIIRAEVAQNRKEIFSIPRVSPARPPKKKKKGKREGGGFPTETEHSAKRGQKSYVIYLQKKRGKNHSLW